MMTFRKDIIFKERIHTNMSYREWPETKCQIMRRSSIQTTQIILNATNLSLALKYNIQKISQIIYNNINHPNLAQFRKKNQLINIQILANLKIWETIVTLKKK